VIIAVFAKYCEDTKNLPRDLSVKFECRSFKIFLIFTFFRIRLLSKKEAILEKEAILKEN
jgi:hypothetical protein